MSNFPPNYPEEYQIGHVFFLGKKYRVTPSVLIPRLETESLIKRARSIIQEKNIETVVDIGSGSGIIGTSLADISKNLTFLDISEQALEIAKYNFETNFPDKKADFIVSDLLKNFKIKNADESIMFVTNLPYIKNADWNNMSKDTKHEPKLALFGGEKHGFELYERLFEEIKILKNIYSGNIYILFEFGFDQREIAETVLKKYTNWKYRFFADYAGIERFGEIIINS
ncbi:peptide chain release factor N(5)-glutamine methyltransferase [Candidatus Gracilibacteria bacterium]|nr:peptide chain release factor N(5)-glutamine methyltransferase [Candidatus Gracilibacteria bacterium]